MKNIKSLKVIGLILVILGSIVTTGNLINYIFPPNTESSVKVDVVELDEIITKVELKDDSFFIFTEGNKFRLYVDKTEVVDNEFLQNLPSGTEIKCTVSKFALDYNYEVQELDKIKILNLTVGEKVMITRESHFDAQQKEKKQKALYNLIAGCFMVALGIGFLVSYRKRRSRELERNPNGDNSHEK